MTKCGALFCLILLPVVCQAAEEAPLPYEVDEFPEWLVKLRRAEVIMVGAFPFCLFLSFEVYDIFRFLSHLGDENRTAYAPWPFRAPDAISYIDSENVGLLAAAIATSVVFAAVDFIVGQVRGREAEQD